jgi:pimeloyl-ACP methyl ester carboxylesterase
MATRVRVLGFLALTFAPALAGCAFEEDADSDQASESEGTTDSVGQALVSDVAVYTNTSLASGWQTWSWSTAASFANTDAPLASGSTSHIKAVISSAGGALSLARSTGDLRAADYDTITFDVRATWSSSVSLRLQTLGGQSGGAQATIPVTTTWTRRTVKVADIKGSLTSFGKINWVASQSGQTIYVDNLRLVAATTTSASYPTAPITVQKGTVVTLSSSASPYSLYVPGSYDATHRTPSKLLVWLHGCGGYAAGDAWATSPGGTQSWVTVSVGGRDGACWNMSTDGTMVLAALDDVKRRLNIDPRRVVIGGYSSGGNLAYRTAFYNAKRFAGVLAEDTAPFYGTGSSQSASIAAAAWKLNVVHLAHVSDGTFRIATVRAETDALTGAGFPAKRIERAGTHWDPDTSSSGTNYDMRTYLLPYLDAGWLAPQ